MSRCICGHQWDDHATWCYSSGCPCHFKRAPEVSVAALLAELEAGVEGLSCECLDHSECAGCHGDGDNLTQYVPTAAVLDLIRKAGKP